MYVSRNTRIVLECDKKHTWSTKIARIKSGSWCYECGLEVKDETKDKISKTLIKYNKTKEGKKKKKKAHEKRSETMREENEKLREEVTSKKCANCNMDKPLEDFGKRSTGKLGRQSYCRKCVQIAKKKSREKEKARESNPKN